MATTVTAQEQLQLGDQREAKTSEQPSSSPWLKLDVRARQIALITLLVALVVVVTTAVNVANLTAVIISRTAEEATRVSNQIDYAVQQELAHNRTGERLNDYAALLSDHSGVRGLMESTIVTSHTIAYVYLANVSGQIISDAEGRHELAANRHMIGDAASDRPGLDQLANQSGYVQLVRVLLGPSIYEHRERLPIVRKNTGEPEGTFSGQLHIGVSAGAVRRELLSPVAINLIIGLLAIIGAGIVAISSANLLLRPLEAISTSIDRLGMSDQSAPINELDLPRDQLIT